MAGDQATYDVVVVGGGPAGATVAEKVAHKGFRVALLEEHQQIGRPLHCSGFVSPRTIAAGDLIPRLVLNEVRGAVVHSTSGKQLLLGGDRTYALVLDRIELDKELAHRAHEAGAEVRLGARVAALEMGKDGVAVSCHHPSGERSSVWTRLVIGADGHRSCVARALGAPQGPLISCVGAEVRLPGHPRDLAQVFVGPDIAPGWFGWSIPVIDDIVRIGIGTEFSLHNGAGNSHGPSVKPITALHHLFKAFPNLFQGVEVLSYSGGFIPLYTPMKTYGERVLLVGDAARQVKAFSGGGIYLSLVAAGYAAETAVQALAEDNLSEASLARYQAHWEAELGVELRRGAEIRQLYVSLSQNQLDRLLQVLSFPLLRRITALQGDIDFPSPMFSALLRTAPALKWVLGLSHMPKWNGD